MELNLCEITFTSFNSVNLTEFTAVNNLIAMVTMEKPQFSKAHLTTLNLSNFKTIEAMRLKITASRSTIMALPLNQIS
jgi:hypothetical protein